MPRFLFRLLVLVAAGACARLPVTATETTPTLLEQAFAFDSADASARDAARAAQLYAAAAATGDAHAHLRLGYLCEVGDGVPQDYAAAREHYQTAATLGLAAARVPLAICHLEGWGGPIDREAFLREIRLAADAGEAPAQRILGNLLTFGIFAPKDVSLALVWLERAAKSDALAQHDLGVVIERAHQFVTQRNVEIARNWYQLSAESEYLAGMRAMARTFIDRSHGAPDWESFNRWLALADEAGDAEAPYILAMSELRRGGATPPDEARVRAWVERAAQRGNQRAIEVLDLVGTGRTLRAAFHQMMTVAQDDRYIQRMQRRAGDGPDRPPVPYKIVRPVYPLSFRLTGVTGNVTLEFIVDTAGRVRDIKTVATTHPLLAERAKTALEQWRFEAPRKNGRVANCRVQLTFPFQFNDEVPDGVDGLLAAARGKAELLGPEFEALAVDLRLARPIATLPIPPSAKSSANEPRFAFVLLAIDAAGQPIRGRVLDAQPKELGDEVLAIALTARFQPRQINKAAVPSNALLPFFPQAMRAASPTPDPAAPRS